MKYEGVEIRDAISIVGMRKLLAMKQCGKPLPAGWRDSVVGYLKFKLISIKRLENELNGVRAQYSEALHIAKKLGVEI